MAVELSPSNVVIEQIDINLLKPHPRNTEIYGEEDISSLLKDIKEHGLKERIIVTQDNIVVSGNSRLKVLGILEFKVVPIERRFYANEIEVLEALLLANAFRHKTNKQKASEGKMWEEIFERKNKEKQESQGDTGRELGTKSKIEIIKQSSIKPTEEEQPLGGNFPQGVPSDISITPNAGIKPKPASTKKPRAPRTRDLVAKSVGLGDGKNYDKASNALEVIEKLKQKGKEEEAKALEEIMNKSLDGANKITKLPEDEQIIALQKYISGKVKTAQAAIIDIKKDQIIAQAQAAPTKPNVTLASWETWLPEQELCDLLVTDPPFSTDVDDIEAFASAWLPVALSKVKPTGRAYVCIGAYPHELKAYLNVQGCLPVAQVLVWSYRNTLGPSPKYDYKLNWQAILYFKGIDAPSIDYPIMNEQFSVQEINAPDGRQGNRYHTWQKPDQLAEQLIRHSTKPGDTVIDCFTGTGTFLLAAHKLGRVASGCEQSPEMIEIARTRGCEVLNA